MCGRNVDRLSPEQERFNGLAEAQALAAMDIVDSIRCGPAPYSCDGASDGPFTCPAHGGEVLIDVCGACGLGEDSAVHDADEGHTYEQDEVEPEACKLAREDYERRMGVVCSWSRSRPGGVSR